MQVKGNFWTIEIALILCYCTVFVNDPEAKEIYPGFALFLCSGCRHFNIIVRLNIQTCVQSSGFSQTFLSLNKPLQNRLHILITVLHLTHTLSLWKGAVQPLNHKTLSSAPLSVSAHLDWRALQNNKACSQCVLVWCQPLPTLNTAATRPIQWSPSLALTHQEPEMLLVGVRFCWECELVLRRSGNTMHTQSGITHRRRG